MIRNFLKQEA